MIKLRSKACHRNELLQIAETIETNGGWHIAALRIRAAADRIRELEAAIEQVVKRTPFVASATGITLEMPFETIRLLQAAMKGREKPP